MPTRRSLSPKFIEALKPAPAGKRIDYMEAITPGFGVRVTDSGAKSFVLIARFGGNPYPTRRTIGNASKMMLADARKRAGVWSALIANGEDPAEVEREAGAAKAREKANTVASAVERYLARRVKGQRRAEKVEREIRCHILPKWQGRPIAEITRNDVAKLVEGVAEESGLYQAHNIFGHVRGIFNWAIKSGAYGLETSPCDRLEATALAGGAKKARNRVLSDVELRAYCNAAAATDEPFGPMFRLLALTGQRRSEVSNARWCEFHPDLVKLLRARAAKEVAGEPAEIDWPQVPDAVKVWTIPPERFKSDRSHAVPLSNDACGVLAGLPFYKAGDHLFTTTLGEKPVSGLSKAKARLDKHMKRALGELSPFVIHDVRRTVRTRLSGLRVADHVAEIVIGHGRKGIAGVYDQYSYLDEKRDALDRWAAALRAIVDPPPSNVVALTARAS